MGKIKESRVRKLRAKRNRIKRELDGAKGKELEEMRKERKRLDDEIWKLIKEGHSEKIEGYIKNVESPKIQNLLDERKKAQERMEKAKEEGKFQEAVKIRTKLDEIKQEITSQLAREGEILDLSRLNAKKAEEQERPTRRRQWSGVRKKGESVAEKAKEVEEWEVKKERGIRRVKTPSKVEDVVLAKARGLIENSKAKGRQFRTLQELKEAIKEELPKSERGEPYLSTVAIGNILRKEMKVKPQLKEELLDIKQGGRTKEKEIEREVKKEETAVPEREKVEKIPKKVEEVSEQERVIWKREDLDELKREEEKLERELDRLKERNSGWGDSAMDYQQKQTRGRKRRRVIEELRRVRSKIESIKKELRGY